MPWMKNKNGEDEYKVSLYAKEELPTWDEMYNEFYRYERFSYSPSNIIIDPYWKIPRAVVLLSICCNQLNKMIFEDKIDVNMGWWDDARFVIEGYKNTTNPDMYNICTGNPPPIYSLHNPNGKLNPFIINDHKRIYIEDEDETGYGYLKLIVSRGLHTEVLQPKLHCIWYYDVIDKLIRPLRDYFEGEDKPGWKDSNGKLLHSKIENSCLSGFDPAL